MLPGHPYAAVVEEPVDCEEKKRINLSGSPLHKRRVYWHNGVGVRALRYATADDLEICSETYINQEAPTSRPPT